MKFNKSQNLAVKQCQDKTRFLQKRHQDNTARVARGEDPLPEEDVNKLFKPLPPPNRLNALVLSGQINSSAHQVSQFCSQSLAKWFLTEALQQAKMSDPNPWTETFWREPPCFVKKMRQWRTQLFGVAHFWETTLNHNFKFMGKQSMQIHANPVIWLPRYLG